MQRPALIEKLRHAVPGLLMAYPARLFEWCMSFALVMIGVHLLIWPESATISSFKVAILSFGSTNVAILCLVVGLCRAVALARNGQWPTLGWLIRAICASLAAGVWGQMVLTLYYVPEFGAPSPFIWMYISLTAAEVLSTFRAVLHGY